MKNKEIISALIGGACFAIPYAGLSIALIPSLAVGAAASVASSLILSDIKLKDTLKNSDKTLYEKVNTAKGQNKIILGFIPKIQNSDTKKNLKEINETITKILNVIEKDYKKGDRLNNFFDYYLPVLIKILNKYDEIENQKLVSKEGKNFITKADKMIDDTNAAFKQVLASLYQDDITDADADMNVYNLMLKADGMDPDNLLMKGDEDGK